jgi:hypothetical protein
MEFEISWLMDTHSASVASDAGTIIQLRGKILAMPVLPVMGVTAYIGTLACM